MTAVTTDHPCDALAEVNQVTSCLSFLLDQASRDRTDGMTGNELRGLSAILRWVRDQIEGARQSVEDRLNVSDIDMLGRVGLPEEAFEDEGLRRSWQSGFAHGLSHAARESGT